MAGHSELHRQPYLCSHQSFYSSRASDRCEACRRRYDCFQGDRFCAERCGVASRGAALGGAALGGAALDSGALDDAAVCGHFRNDGCESDGRLWPLQP